jgi:hypothetical protein
LDAESLSAGRVTLSVFWLVFITHSHPVLCTRDRFLGLSGRGQVLPHRSWRLLYFEVSLQPAMDKGIVDTMCNYRQLRNEGLEKRRERTLW